MLDSIAMFIVLHTTIHMGMRRYTPILASFDIHWFWMHTEIDTGIASHYVQYSFQNQIKRNWEKS